MASIRISLILRDRLTAMRDLLTESGSIFIQIGDDNVHIGYVPSWTKFLEKRIC